MQQSLGKEILNAEDRRMFLKDNCETVEKVTYMKRFSTDELNEMKESLSDLSIRMNDIEEEKKEMAKDFKFQLEPLVNEKKRVLEGLKKKSEEVEEPCFKFVDEETRMVGYYNNEGDLVYSRPAFGNELQGNLFKQNLTKVS